MLLSLFILLPLLAGASLLMLKDQKPMTWVGTTVSASLLVMITTLVCQGDPSALSFQTTWFSFHGLTTYFALNADHLGGLMVLLSNLVFLAVYGYFQSAKINYSNTFLGLMLITLAGLNGVFMSQDLVLFYFFWEVVLIPVYFLIGIYGISENKLKINMTFFLYTVLGSMFMLAGILYIGFYLQPNSFLWEDVSKVTSAAYGNTSLIACLFLIAFAIKVPLFPFHTWQPLAYSTAPTPVTIVLSALMAKMGLFAISFWFIGLFPMFDDGFTGILYIAIIGLIYASLIALTSSNVKKIVAYSSIAHLALIFVALFTGHHMGIYGAQFQMFSHGIVVLGLWICVDIMERKYDVKELADVSGIAKMNPALSILFLVFSLANVALPLTSSFIGEFMMLNALFQFDTALGVMACLGVILSAAYTFRVVGALLFGPTSGKATIENLPKENLGVIVILTVVALIIIYYGVQPSTVFTLLTR